MRIKKLLNDVWDFLYMWLDLVEGGREPDPVPILKIDLVIELGSDIIESGSLPDDTGGSQNTDMDISVEFGTDVTE